MVFTHRKPSFFYTVYCLSLVYFYLCLTFSTKQYTLVSRKSEKREDFYKCKLSPDQTKFYDMIYRETIFYSIFLYGI